MKCNYYVNGTECPSGYEFDETDDRSLAVEVIYIYFSTFI